jgi:hypothetical protein
MWPWHTSQTTRVFRRIPRIDDAGKPLHLDLVQTATHNVTHAPAAVAVKATATGIVERRVRRPGRCML